jgi:hypothetical protein
MPTLQTQLVFIDIKCGLLIWMSELNDKRLQHSWPLMKRTGPAKDEVGEQCRISNNQKPNYLVLGFAWY